MPGPFDKMVCLVGENPLPVYLGIKQLATPAAEVVLVYSEATKAQAQNIKAILNKAKVTNGNRGRTCIMNQVVQLRDPYCPRQVRETLDAVVARLSNPRPYALNYTGAIRRTFFERKGFTNRATHWLNVGIESDLHFNW
jgi:hypothetical protein